MDRSPNWCPICKRETEWLIVPLQPSFVRCKKCGYLKEFPDLKVEKAKLEKPSAIEKSAIQSPEPAVHVSANAMVESHTDRINYFEYYGKTFIYAVIVAVIALVVINFPATLLRAGEGVVVISALPPFLKFASSVMAILGFAIVFDVRRREVARKKGYFKDAPTSTKIDTQQQFLRISMSLTIIAIVLMFLFGIVYLCSSVINLKNIVPRMTAGDFSGFVDLLDREPEYGFWLVYVLVVLLCGGELIEQGIRTLRKARKIHALSFGLDENIDLIVQSFLIALIGIIPLIVTSFFPAKITTQSWHPIYKSLEFPPEGGSFHLPNGLEVTALLPGLICALGFIIIYAHASD